MTISTPTTDPAAVAHPFAVRLATQHWGIAGPDERPQVLLLHGLTSSAGTWWRVASDLADAGWSVTAPDLRGHGVSPRTTRYGLADYAADVAAVRAPGERPWDLVIGHSLGGAVAVVVAAEHPEWTDALLLLDPVLSVADAEAGPLIADLLGDLHHRDPAALLAANPLWHPEDAAQKAEAVRVATPYLVERTIRDSDGWQLHASAARITARTRVLAADPDLGASFTRTQGEAIAAANPRFGFAVVAGAGHSVHRDDPARVVAEALDHLAG